MKFIGALLITASFSLIGYNYSMRLTKRFKIARQLVLMAELMKVKISCNLEESVAIIKKLSNYDSLKDLKFLKIIDTKDCPLSVAFENSVNSCDLPLNDDDIELLISLGNGLGTTDCEGQIGILDSFIEQMKKSTVFYGEEQKRLSKLYLSFGFFGGIATSILFL